MWFGRIHNTSVGNQTNQNQKHVRDPIARWNWAVRPAPIFDYAQFHPTFYEGRKWDLWYQIHV